MSHLAFAWSAIASSIAMQRRDIVKRKTVQAKDTCVVAALRRELDRGLLRDVVADRGLE
ncbi:MAG TPA: hypothetical protein VGM59_11545 [Dongiaceae bacterium]|jgi:hypothetical protein